MTYGRSIRAALDEFNIGTDEWASIAARPPGTIASNTGPALRRRWSSRKRVERGSRKITQCKSLAR